MCFKGSKKKKTKKQKKRRNSWVQSKLVAALSLVCLACWPVNEEEELGLYVHNLSLVWVFEIRITTVKHMGDWLFMAYNVWCTRGSMFVRRWNRMDGKLWKENGEEKYFGGCFVEKGRGKNDGGAYLSQQKCFLSKIERKLGGEKSYMWRTKMPMCKLHMRFFNMFVCLFFFFFLFACDFFFYKWFLFFNKFWWLYAYWLFVTFLFQLGIVF